MQINLRAPLEPGGYALKLDLVDEGICWFEEAGSTPRILDLTVAGATERT